MDLSKTVACAALLIVVVLAAGHALAQESAADRQKQRIEDFTKACTIKSVMSDAEIEKCRIAHRQ